MRVLLYIVVLIVAVSCRTTEYVPVPYEVKSTEYVNKHVRDSIYKHDSIYLTMKGDTVLLEKWHTKYVDKLRIDTIVKCDSIPVPYSVIKEVNRLTKWQEIIQSLGYVGIGEILLFIGWLIFKLYSKTK